MRALSIFWLLRIKLLLSAKDLGELGDWRDTVDWFEWAERGDSVSL